MIKMDGYVPTPTELKLLETMANPDNRGLSITDICQMADISRQTYYNLFKKSEFVKYYDEFLLRMVKSSMGDILKATMRFAETDSRAHADRKILLEMGKLYQQKQEIDHNVKSVYFSGEDELKD